MDHQHRPRPGPLPAPGELVLHRRQRHGPATVPGNNGGCPAGGVVSADSGAEARRHRSASELIREHNRHHRSVSWRGPVFWIFSGVITRDETAFSIHSLQLPILKRDEPRPGAPAPGDSAGSGAIRVGDLVVICDPAKLTRQGCTGAPDFVLEILSPATAFKDMEDKLHLYERHGVREYWIINPGNDTLMVYSILPAEDSARGYRKPVLHTRDDTVSPRIFPDLSIELSRVFDRDR
ncbi:MAG: Uma2 family endonuclease [Spirochaetaceae bacterium]|nr:MAG: Uma2 family endonuclease [Spirochaetaceae bacterium]